MCEKCKNYEPSVSIPPKGTPMREIKTGRIFFSTGIKKDNKIQLSQSIYHTSDYCTWLALSEEMEVVEITPVKIAPPKGTVVIVWNNDKPPYPMIKYSAGELIDGKLVVMRSETDDEYSTITWNNWEVVKQ